VPVFAARERDLGLIRMNLQGYDPVTIIDSENRRESHIVAHGISPEELAVNPSPGFAPIPQSPGGVQLAAFFGPVGRDYEVDGLHNRILKWPSGELIGDRFLAIRNPVAGYGPAEATIDEVKNVASSRVDVEVREIAYRGIPEVRTGSLALTGISKDYPSGMAVIGEEIVGFADTRGMNHLTHCTRGWLNSPATVHDRGDAVFVVDFLPVAAIARAEVASTTRYVRLSQGLLGRNYETGYALIEREVIGFEEALDRGRQLDTLPRFDGSGLFRGMFGTDVDEHPEHSMVFGIPFRYYDGYKPGEFDNRMPYFQVAHTTRDARWKSLRFEATRDGDDRRLRIHGFVRIDGLGDFTRIARDAHSDVWDFVGAGRHSLEDTVSSRLENGQFDIRWQLEYLRGSYWPADSWKRTWKLKEARVEYDRDTKVLFHEED
jgi:hypothetical protein